MRKTGTGESARAALWLAQGRGSDPDSSNNAVTTRTGRAGTRIALFRRNRSTEMAHRPFWLVATVGTLLLGACANEKVRWPPTATRGTDAAAPRAMHAPADHAPADPSAPPAEDVVLPGEFEPVDRLLIGFHDDGWTLLPFFEAVISEALRQTRVTVVVRDALDGGLLRSSLRDAGIDTGSVDFVYAPLDSVWMRDYGPLVTRTRTKRRIVVDLLYDQERAGDDAVPEVVADALRLPMVRPPVDMDGGHLLSDGAGRCIVSDDLVDRNLVWGYDEAELREVLARYLGCTDTVVLPALLDEPTGHVDVFTYVTGPGKVVLGRYRQDQDSINAARLSRSAKLLKAAGFEVVRMPMPDNDGRKVFRTYTNALALNGAVLVPVYRESGRYERRALRIFEEAFPGRAVVPVEADEIMELSGAVHCATMTIAK